LGEYKGKGDVAHGRSFTYGRPDGFVKDLEGLSREMVELLRHRGLPQMRPDGFAPLEAVVNSLSSRPSTAQVEEVVSRSFRPRDGLPRFELLVDNGMKFVRACGKHSLPSVDMWGSSQQITTAASHERIKHEAVAQPAQDALEDCAKERSSIQREHASTDADMLPSDTQEVAAALHANTRSEAAAKSAQQADEIYIREGRLQGCALEAFDASNWGDEYIALKRGERLLLCRNVPEDNGWAYGKTTNACGWFPATHWVSLREFDMMMELESARKEIETLKSEVARSAGLAETLDAALKRYSPSPLNCSRPSHSHDSEPLSQPIATLSGKDSLQSFLAENFPSIKGDGVIYSTVESKKDGNFFRARVEIAELGFACCGGDCGTQFEAEQSAAARLLAELGGPA